MDTMGTAGASRRFSLVVVILAVLLMIWTFKAARSLLGTTGAADESAGKYRGVPFEHRIIDSHAMGHRAIDDVDGDGRNDIIAVDLASQDNTITWYGFPEWNKHTIVRINQYTDFRLYRSDALEAADMDGDADPDIVGRIGPSDDGDGVVVWWENPRPTGDPGTQLWRRHDIGYTDYVKDLAVADLDMDGRADLAARETEKTHIFVQGPSAAWKRVNVIQHHPHEGLAIGDLDLDGDPDLVLNGFWLENPHPRDLAAPWIDHSIDRKWWDQTGHRWKDNNCNVEVSDINDDGRPDVLLSQSELPGYPVSWYEAAPPKQARWTEHRIEEVFDYCQTLQAADLDNDGDMDVLAAMFPRYRARSYPVVIYRNSGKGSAWTKQELADTGMYHGRLGAVGSDGDIDVLGVRNYDSPPIELWENKTADDCVPSLDDWTYKEVDRERAKWGDWDKPSWARYLGLAMGDLSGDGYADIVSGRYLYRNPGGDTTGSWARLDFGVNCDASLILDVDGDPYGDVIASAGDKVLWLESDDTSGDSWTARTIDSRFPRPHHGNPQGYKLAQLVPGGKPEILLHGDGGVFFYQVPLEPARGEWPRSAIVNTSNGEGIGVGDINSDGWIDLAVAHEPQGWHEGDARYIKWCANPGDVSGDWTEYLVGTIDGNWPDRIAVADLNGDERPDIIVTEEGQKLKPMWKVYWFEAPARPTRGDWQRHVIVSLYTTNSMDVADMDDDGDIDIVLGEHRGTKSLAVWENDGHGFFSQHVVDRGKESHLGARVADLDADGDLEIVSISWDDYQYLHLWINGSNRCDGRETRRLRQKVTHP